VIEKLTVSPDAPYNTAIGRGKDALPMLFVVLESTDVFITIG